MADTTVLLVDDAEDTRLIHGTLLQLYGYRVLEARNGQEAVRIAGERLPHAILMDLSMPVLDGWGAIEALRRDPNTAEIPVIVFTAYNTRDCRERAAAAGCAGFLTKPCGAEALASRVADVTAPRARSG